jgi:pimeloyl-ACP methyl ester carboxylesterase
MRAVRRLVAWLGAACAGILLVGPVHAGIADVLDDLGGKPCPGGSDFTCVTIEVPLDHFNPSDTRTIDVVLAVLPASGNSKGLFVTATGGPGSAGIGLADYYTSYFDPSIRRRFDIVFFDQRGIGLSGGLVCPAAYGVFLQSVAPPSESASRFSNDCVTEMGSPAILPFVGTAQAVEDLEAFLRVLGSPPMWLYGESYGTQYAQEYAAAHADALDGLILDGTVDLTLSGPAFWADAAASFERILDETLASCDSRLRCRKDAGGSAGGVYDRLAEQLAAQPARVSFPLPSGGTAERELGPGELQTVAAGQSYGENGRMLLQRVIAAAGRGDLVPLMRLVYANMYVDPETLEPVPDPTYSDAMYFGVDCQDYAYYSGTPEERAAQYVAAATGIAAELPRVGEAVFLSDLPCAFWPNATQDQARPPPLRADGIPTLVLAATGDPITPVGESQAVYSRLADGYLVTTRGGPHVTFGRGNFCPDDLVRDFLVDGKAPAKRETTCPGRLVDPYVPLAPETAASFRSVRAAFVSAQTELEYLPEYYYWDFETPTSAGCPTGGGTVRFTARGSVAGLQFKNCGFTKGFTMSGPGRWDYATGRVVFDVTVAGRFAGSYRYVHEGGSVSVDEH